MAAGGVMAAQAAGVIAAQAAGEPVISVDTKKKERVGAFRNGGSDYRPQGEPQRVTAMKIRGWILRDGHGIRTVARETGLSRTTIEKSLKK